ncbi:hypothetical protein ACFWXO_16740 [Kitasatospora sp. NPDC059088]|uniref:hypothetical protein n=1 Tax=Kitasatospora sp. NPDC059088 TaxID=3346722 RepID=UPI0036BBDC2D
MSEDTAVSPKSRGPIEINASLITRRDLSSSEREVLLHIIGSAPFDPVVPWVQRALRGLQEKNLVVKTADGYRVAPEVAL